MHGISTREISIRSYPDMMEVLGLRQEMEAPRRRSLHLTSAEHHGLGEAGLAGFLVLAVHFFGGLSQRNHGFVEIDAVPGRDLVAGDGVGGPGFDRAECA